MRLVFAPEARREFEEAGQYYRLQLPGLELQFREEVRSTLRRLQTWPLAFPAEQKDIRRALLRQFPYKLLYSVETDHIYIIAVAHQHRKPNYWSGRANSQ
jgi:plasmid stabilization system protein ParE